MAGLEEMVRPDVDEKGATELAWRLWAVRGRKIVRLNGYDDKNFWIQDAEIGANPYLASVNRPGYVLKVMNSEDSKNADYVSDQNTLLINLGKNGVECPQPQPTIEGTLYKMERLETNGPLHAVRLLSFVPGEILDRVPWIPHFALQAGHQLAKIHQILKSSYVPALERRSIPWSLWSASKSGLPYVHVVEEDDDRATITEVLTLFQNRISQSQESLNLRESVIHGDYNEQNVLVRPDGESYSIAAILDMGDSHRAPVLFEICIAATYMALKANEKGKEAAEAALRDVIKGFKEAGGLITENEHNLFMLCVCARLAQSLVLGLKAHREDPSNLYVLATQRYGWPLLRHLWETHRTTFNQSERSTSATRDP